MTPEERFWSHVDKNGPVPVDHPELGPCWLWIASVNHRGYGQTTLNGVSMAAHRAAWILTNGPVPPGVMVCHRCDVRRCVRSPEPSSHHFLGTARTNTADMFAKGRNGAVTHPERLARGDRNGARLHPERLVRGERHHSAKLTATDVAAIRRALANGQSVRGIARECGVDPAAIRQIRDRITWRHVP